MDLRCFSADGWIPRGECGPWTEFLAWLYATSDFATAAAYFAIPLILLVGLREDGRVRARARAMTYQESRLARVTYAAFILACGLDHLEGPLSFLWPAYPVFATANAIVALVSWAAVLVTFHLRTKLVLALS